MLAKKLKNEAKEQRGGFLSKLLRALGASLLGNLLRRKSLGNLSQILKYKNNIKTNLNLMVFIQKTIHLKQRMRQM